MGGLPTPPPPVPFGSYADARANETHTNWSVPQPLPEPPHLVRAADSYRFQRGRLGYVDRLAGKGGSPPGGMC